MDHDKKKKKRNKKKNKQKKAPESLGIGGSGERETDYSSSSSSVNLIGLAKEHDHLHSQVPGNVSGRNADLGHHSHLPPNGLREPVTIEAEKQNWLKREAILEDTIEQLQNENHSLIQKKATLEEMTKQLQNEVYTYKQEEASLETKLEELQAEKDSWIEKEASLEENIKSLESEKESWILKENTAKETIASLNDDIARLKAQVVELEESRKNLSEEKRQMVEIVSGMQSQIQNLKRGIASDHTSNETLKYKDLKSELEGERALAARLISENAELVEKVHELYAEVDQLNATVRLSAAAGNDLNVETAEIVTVADPIKSPEVMPLDDGTFDNDSAVPIFSEADESGEIEQTPLEYNEIVALELLEAGKTNENALLPISSDAPPPPSADPLLLSDAPLIGAPFRLISFVARYVSGADLVNKGSSDSSS